MIPFYFLAALVLVAFSTVTLLVVAEGMCWLIDVWLDWAERRQARRDWPSAVVKL